MRSHRPKLKRKKGKGNSGSSKQQRRVKTLPSEVVEEQRSEPWSTPVVQPLSFDALCPSPTSPNAQNMSSASSGGSWSDIEAVRDIRSSSVDSTAPTSPAISEPAQNTEPSLSIPMFSDTDPCFHPNELVANNAGFHLQLQQDKHIASTPVSFSLPASTTATASFSPYTDTSPLLSDNVLDLTLGLPVEAGFGNQHMLLDEPQQPCLWQVPSTTGLPDLSSTSLPPTISMSPLDHASSFQLPSSGAPLTLPRGEDFQEFELSNSASHQNNELLTDEKIDYYRMMLWASEGTYQDFTSAQETIPRKTDEWQHSKTGQQHYPEHHSQSGQQYYPGHQYQ